MLGVATQGAGFISTTGVNGSENVALSSLLDFPSHGFVAVKDSTGTNQVGMYVDENGNGVVFATLKPFRIPHPYDPSKEIWYASLEGPEAAAYVRGTGTLTDGEATVSLPEHFLAIANVETLTVQLTPLSASSLGLVVVTKHPALEVRELHNGTGTYDFDYFLTAKRKGLEDFQVVRPAKKT